MKLAASLALALLSGAAAVADESVAPPGSVWKRVRVEGHGAVLLPIPEAWRASARRDSPSAPTTLVLTPPQEEPPAFEIAIAIVPWDSPALPTNVDKLRNVLEAQLKSRPADRKNRPAVVDFTSPSLKGCYYADLRLNTPKNGFVYETQGAGVLDELVVNFTARSNRAGEPAVAAMLESVQAVRREPTGSGGPLLVRLPGHGTITLPIPSGWESKTRPAGPGLPPTVEFGPGSGAEFEVLITPLWKASPPPFDLPGVRELVIKTRAQALARAKDAEPPILELTGTNAKGYYFSAEDLEYKGGPGDWRYMTQGSALLDDLLVTFTALGNDARQPEATALFAMLQSATRDKEAVTAGPPATLAARVTLPGKAWSLVLDLPGFKRESEETRPDGSGAMMMASNEGTGLIVSAFIEREKKRTTTEECRKLYWGKGSGLVRRDVREEARGDLVAVHWMVPEAGGVALRQKNINAYAYRDGTCIDIHISKAGYAAEDESLFTTVLDSVRFVKNAP
jgi:hypothetical protein